MNDRERYEALDKAVTDFVKELSKVLNEHPRICMQTSSMFFNLGHKMTEIRDA